jgi:hypothetical protein
LLSSFPERFLVEGSLEWLGARDNFLRAVRRFRLCGFRGPSDLVPPPMLSGTTVKELRAQPHVLNWVLAAFRLLEIPYGLHGEVIGLPPALRNRTFA